MMNALHDNSQNDHERAKPTPRAGRFVMLTRVCLFAALAAVGAGCQCYEMHDEIDTFKMKCRFDYCAHRAWWRTRDCYCDVDHKCDFKRGFMAGYRGTAMGGDGCVPMLPPRRYWCAHYQTCEGHNQTAAWFRGYEHGVLLAEQEGVSQFSHLMTSQPIAPQYGPVPDPYMQGMPVDYAAPPMPAPPAEGPAIMPPPPAPAYEENLPPAAELPTFQSLDQKPGPENAGVTQAAAQKQAVAPRDDVWPPALPPLVPQPKKPHAQIARTVVPSKAAPPALVAPTLATEAVLLAPGMDVPATAVSAEVEAVESDPSIGPLPTIQPSAHVQPAAAETEELEFEKPIVVE